jgi:hypothetical protein
MDSIEAPCVHAFHIAHDPLEVSLGGVKGKMVMGLHETIRKDPNMPSARGVLNQG